MRAARSMAVEVALVEHQPVADAVAALVEALGADEGSLSSTLAALAMAQAAQVDAGSPAAANTLRLTLQALNEAAGLTERDDADWFDTFEIRFSITREGIKPTSRLGRRLLAWMAESGGRGELLSWYPPPMLPYGWRGTAVDGDPAEYAERHGQEYPRPEPLAFWPPAPCEACGHVRQGAAPRGARRKGQSSGS